MIDDTKERKKLLGFANGNINVVVDAGNARVKMGTDAAWRGMIPLSIAHMTHAIAEITRSEYDELCYRYQGGKERHFIACSNRYFVVGDAAFNFDPTFDPKRGRLKYERDYYGILFIGGLLHLFGDAMPEALNAMLAHPPADLALRETLMRCVVGRWHFESNGVKYTTHVEHVNTFDEIVGGVFNHTIAPDGKPFPKVDVRGNSLVFDLGGGTLDLAMLVDGKVDYTRKMDSTRIGANVAINNFKHDFDAQYPDLVSHYEDGLPRDLVHEIFLSETHTLQLAAGEEMDCSKLYQRSIAPVIRSARDSVRAFAGNMMGIRRVILTGGVSGLLHNELCQQVFPTFHERGAVDLADAKEEMLKANARGGLKLLEGLKIESARRAKTGR